MKTSVTKDALLQSIQGVDVPFMLAQEWYKRHTSLSFKDDLVHYLLLGQVLNTPNVFAMGKVINLEGEAAFFVRFACGLLSEAMKYFPPGVKWIAFCRRNKGNVRKYPVARFAYLCQKQPSLLLQQFMLLDLEIRRMSVA